MASAFTGVKRTFWEDDYILKLSLKEKYFFLYLITNNKVQHCGIYELPISKVCFETSLPAEEIMFLLKKFSDDKKICYSMETQEICIINWIKHNSTTSWNTMEAVRKQLMDIKNPPLMLILYDPRKPLFEGYKKKYPKEGDPIHTIENPWKEYFSKLSDSELLEIRAPYANKCKFMKPPTSPLHTPSTITIPEHNQDNNNNQYNTIQETEHFCGSAKDKFNQFLNCWNELLPDEGIPIPLNLSLDSEHMNFVSITEFEHYEQCVKHYAEAYDFNKTRLSGFKSTLKQDFIMNWYSPQSVENCRQRSEINNRGKKKQIVKKLTESEKKAIEEEHIEW